MCPRAELAMAGGADASGCRRRRVSARFATSIAVSMMLSQDAIREFSTAGKRLTIRVSSRSVVYYSHMRYAAIRGWGKCMPPAVLSNADLSTFLDTTDEWIVSRTGMKERRVSHVSATEMAAVAC